MNTNNGFRTIYVKRDERDMILSALEHETGAKVDPTVKAVVNLKTAVEKDLKQGDLKVKCVFEKVKNDHRIKGWQARITTALEAISEGADASDLDLLNDLRANLNRIQKEYNRRHNIDGTAGIVE